MKRPPMRWRKVAGVASVLMLSGAAPAASAWAAADPAACDAHAMDALRAAAQAQSESTPRMAESMMSCPSKDEVLLWLSFYYRARGEYAKSARAGSQATVAGKNGRDAVFSKAVNGDFDELERRVNNGEPGYGGDAEAHLILARSLTRAGRYDDARKNYEHYLELKGDDTDVRIEETYSYVWEGVYDEAQNRFEQLLRSGLPPEEEEAAKRGIAIVQRKRDLSEHRAVSGPDPSGETTAPEKAPEPIRLVPGTEYYSTSDDFTRTSFKLGVEDNWVNFMGSFDRLSSTHFTAPQFGFPPEQTNAFEGYLQKYAQVGNGTSIGGRLGIYSTTSVQMEFDFRVDPVIDGNWRPTIGAYQVPMAKDVPLPDWAETWVRQGAFIGLGYQDIVEYRYDRVRTTDSGDGNKHLAIVRIGLDRSRAPAEHLDLLLQGEDENYEQASPYFYSPQNVLVISAGLDYKKNLSSNLKGQFTGLYGYASDTERTSTGPVSSGLSRYILSATLDYAIRHNLSVDVGGRIVRASNDADITYYNSTQLWLSLMWSIN